MLANAQERALCPTLGQKSLNALQKSGAQIGSEATPSLRSVVSSSSLNPIDETGRAAPEIVSPCRCSAGLQPLRPLRRAASSSLRSRSPRRRPCPKAVAPGLSEIGLSKNSPLKPSISSEEKAQTVNAKHAEACWVWDSGSGCSNGFERVQYDSNGQTP